MKILILSAVKEFRDSLTIEKLDDFNHLVRLLSIKGYEIRLPHSKLVDKDLYELRKIGKCNIRIFYTFYFSYIYILHAYIKKEPKLLIRELMIAKRRLSLLRNI